MSDSTTTPVADLAPAPDSSCAVCHETWPPGATECPACGCTQTAAEIAAAGKAARDVAEVEADRYELLVLANTAAAGAIRFYAPATAHVVPVTENAAIPDDAIGAVAHVLMDRGAPTYTWCSFDSDGRRLARTLHDALPVQVEHVTLTDPLDWKGGTPTFNEVLDDAKPGKPPTIARSAPAHTAPRRPYTEPAPFDVSPQEIARRIIQSFGDELLIVAPSQHAKKGEFSTGYALDPATGIWRSGGDPWARWLRKIAESMTLEAVTSGMPERAMASTLASINRIKRPGMVEDVLKCLRAELDDLREKGEPCSDVTECRAEELDQSMRYLGSVDGVVDLHTGKLLLPREGREALLTVSTPVRFNPKAKHPAVDRLFAHLGPDAERWWWSALGSAMRTVPKRLYAAVGEPNGGKTTLLNALNWTLGPYASKGARGVLSASNRHSETQLTPGLTDWFMPVRFVLIEEEKRRQTVDAGLVKDLTGGGFLKARGMRENLREGKVGATTIMFANTDSVPRLSLETEGMRDRYRELPYAKVQNIDPSMRDITASDPAFHTALLARLVEWAARTPAPPEDIPEVRAATTERIREDLAEIGEFARRLVPGNDVLVLSDVWASWCEHNGEPVDVKEPGGVSRRRLSTTLRDHVDGLPRVTQIKVNGSPMRGWRGWQLLDEAPEKEVDPPSYDGVDPDQLYVLDGVEVPYREVLRRWRAKGAGWSLTCWTAPVLIDGKEVVDLDEQIELLATGKYEAGEMKPAPGAKCFAVIARSKIQTEAPLPIPTRSLFEGEDAHPAATEAAKLHDERLELLARGLAGHPTDESMGGDGSRLPPPTLTAGTETVAQSPAR